VITYSETNPALKELALCEQLCGSVAPAGVSQQIKDKAVNGFQIPLYSQPFSAWPHCFVVSFLYFS